MTLDGGKGDFHPDISGASRVQRSEFLIASFDRKDPAKK